MVQSKWMRRGHAVALTALLLVLLIAPLVVQAKMMTINGKQYDIAEPGETIPGEVVIRLHKGFTAQDAEALASRQGGTVNGTIPKYNLYKIKLGPPVGVGAQKALQDAVNAAVVALKQEKAVKSVFPNAKCSIPKPVDMSPAQSKAGKTDASENVSGELAFIATTAASSGVQWHHTVINTNYAGTAPTSTPIVAVLDTGVQYDHPDLEGNVLLGKDFVDDDSDPMDENGHGTHCAGLIAATGRSMVKGVSPNTKVLAVRVFDAYGSGSLFSIMEAIVYAVEYTGVRILSLGFEVYKEEENDYYGMYKEVIDDVVAAGVLPVVAAGNRANGTLYLYNSKYKFRPLPAFFPSSFTVGATTENDMRAYFSNYDIGTLNDLTFDYSFVDIVAPGCNILSTTIDNQVVRMSSTSMAASLVAGCAAYVWGIYPDKTVTEVAAQLVSKGSSVNVYYGFPSTEKRVDLMKATAHARTGFVGAVYNGQTGRALQGATVTVKEGGTIVAMAETNVEGFFSITGLTGAKSYTLVVAKTGCSNSLQTVTAVAGKVTNLTKPVFLNQVRPDGQWSVVIDWRSFQPGYYDAVIYHEYDDISGWYPYHWTMTAGTFMAPYLASTTNGTIEMDDGYQGSLSEWPFMKLTTNPYVHNRPVSTFVIKPTSSRERYKIYTVLDNDNNKYYGWGSYKNVTKQTKPAVQARVYRGAGKKATLNAQNATGSGAYWFIGEIKGTTFTPKNVLQATEP